MAVVIFFSSSEAIEVLTRFLDESSFTHRLRMLNSLDSGTVSHQPAKLIVCRADASTHLCPRRRSLSHVWLNSLDSGTVSHQPAKLIVCRADASTHLCPRRRSLSQVWLNSLDSGYLNFTRSAFLILIFCGVISTSSSS